MIFLQKFLAVVIYWDLLLQHKEKSKPERMCRCKKKLLRRDGLKKRKSLPLQEIRYNN